MLFSIRYFFYIYLFIILGWCGSSGAYCGAGTQAAYAFEGSLPISAPPVPAPVSAPVYSAPTGVESSASFTFYDPTTGGGYVSFPFFIFYFLV